MTDTLHISGAAPARTSTNYAALREAGMQWIRLWASDSWTDHNIHDPGITLLEACSYAMTELGLRLELDIADLIKSGESRAPAELKPAHRVLPMGPVDAQDLRRVLLDHPLVGDARIFAPADNEVPLYEQPGDPPLTYTPGTPRVRLSGLYEVLVELADPARDLNTGTYASQIVAGATTYDIELAMPFWDDPEAAPFRKPAVINAVAMIDTGGAWRALPETQSWFGKLTVAYTDDGGTPGTVEVWVLLRVATPLQPASVIPAALLAARVAVESVAAGAPVRRFAERVLAAAEAIDTLRSYLAGWRNLGEQALRIGLARVQEIAVCANLEVTAGIDLERLLARIFIGVDTLLSPQLRLETLAERRAAEADPSRIYDGPLLRRGFIASDLADAAPLSVIYNSDILRIIMQRRSATAGNAESDIAAQESSVGRDIVALTDLTLANYINNRVITANAPDCLHLVEVQRYRPRLSLAKSRLLTVHNGALLRHDPARVQALFNQMQLAAAMAATALGTSPVWPVTSGEALPVDDYTPMQNELPALYGVGNAMLPDSATPARRAAAKQLQGYLLPVEQLLGDVTAQLAHINRFYSGDADVEASYFVRAPFDLPGARGLMRRFDPRADWAAFVVDPNNLVLRALHEAAEDRPQLLDRRNRMLDHLLARQGEDAVAVAQEMQRWARAELDAASLPPAQQDTAIAARRQAADARVLRLKSALLRDLPELDRFRLLASGNPFFGDATLSRIEPFGVGYRWLLAPAGTELLRGVDALANVASAGFAAERAFNQAGRASNYVVVDVGGGLQRLRLFDGTSTGATAKVLAESTQGFGSAAAASAALPGLAATFAARRIESSLSPLERRIAHHTGIRGATRHPSLTATAVYFEFITEAAPPGLVGKRWRLRDAPAGKGTVLLVSADRFDAATDPQAVALAEAALPKPLRYGQDEWNYRVVPSGAGFDIELRDPAGLLVAKRGAALASQADAEAALRATVDHLYRHYGAESLYLVEHLLLRPRRIGDAFLSIPVSPVLRERDPYSQRVSLVFASGLARDFTLPRATAVATETTPDRFRDPEFRRHAEGIVQRDCPAHLLPTVYWVDRESTTANAPASFDTFEARYFAWLDSVLIPGATAAAVDSARNALLESLNAIANDA